MTAFSTPLREALVRARRAVLGHMREAQAVGLTWKEETITDLYLGRVQPEVKVRAFTRIEEGRPGADWLWWFVDPDGTCFGMLNQAKRLKIDPTGWRFDFDYRSGE